MKRKILVVLLALSLVAVCNGGAGAGVLGYNLDKAGEKGFTGKPSSEPSAAKVASDALIARPLGLALTIAGTGVFLVTLPMSVSSPGSVNTAARALVVKPAGYTFIRPFGRPDTRFMEKSIFSQ